MFYARGIYEVLFLPRVRLWRETVNYGTVLEGGGFSTCFIFSIILFVPVSRSSPYPPPFPLSSSTSPCTHAAHFPNRQAGWLVGSALDPSCPSPSPSPCAFCLLQIGASFPHTLLALSFPPSFPRSCYGGAGGASGNGRRFIMYRWSHGAG